MNAEIQAYNDKQTKVGIEIYDLLATTIDGELTEAESKTCPPIHLVLG